MSHDLKYFFNKPILLCYIVSLCGLPTFVRCCSFGSRPVSPPPPPPTAPLSVPTCAPPPTPAPDLCENSECCNDKWILKNITGLENTLRTKLYGQPLILSTLIDSLKIHLNDDIPQKALALSFHGSTGVGKTFVSRLVAEHLFKKGTASMFYRKFVSTTSLSDTRRVNEYRDMIVDQLRASVRECARSLFVFEEMSHMYSQVMPDIYHYIDYDAQFDGLDFRKAIFIFLSNTGGQEINKHMQDLARANKSTEALNPEKLHSIIQRAVINECDRQGELSLRKDLVNHYMPFLPLNRSHVEGCLRDELERRGCLKDYKPDDLQLVLNETVRLLTFEPKDLQLYSFSGCKRLESVVLNLPKTIRTRLPCFA